ncbi:MAG TPA: AGE family epimerase/isomerase [Paludibacteraceae bacterium]|nr:AGE family epimerase/isomerase [Paludibacteraceae bacterium]HPH63354.1 AGE family epimerase/isomerase [Paludibacteraceae bacterium]
MKRDVKSLYNELNEELTHILNFWSDKMADNSRGGFYGEMSPENIVEKDANRGAILNGRILWSFSAAYNYTHKKEELEMAKHAYDYFSKYFIDRKNGGVFWEIDCNGQPINTRKQAYAHGFAIYGLSEYYRASGNAESLALALEIYKIMETHFYDSKYGGYIEALSMDWQPLTDMRLSEKDKNTPKSMNTHLHILEPYTNLYRCKKSEELKNKIIDLLFIFKDKILDNDRMHFRLFFDNDWTPLSEEDSYGHDIEGAWLMCEAAEEISDPKLIDTFNKIAIKIADVTLSEGSDKDGAIFNEKFVDHLDSDKHWWPQAEALIGFTNAWQISGNHEYMDQTEKVWDFIQNHIIDKETGEWFWRVDKNGEIYATEVKAGFWKCPYHNSRAMIEVMNRTNGSK